MNIEIKERYETSEPEKSLVLEGPYWGFRIKEAKLAKFKTEAEKLRDKFANVDIKTFAFISSGMFAVVPKQGKASGDFSIKTTYFQETLDAIVEKVYEKCKFDPKPKQKQLTEKKK